MSNRVIDPTHQHNHSHHEHMHQQAMGQPGNEISSQPYPTMQMVPVQLGGGQQVLIPYTQWQQMYGQQGMGQTQAQAPAPQPVQAAAAPGLGPKIFTVAILEGLGLFSWWAYKRFIKGTETERMGGGDEGGDEDRPRSSRRSRSHMMAEFERFLEERHEHRALAASEHHYEDEGEEEAEHAESSEEPRRHRASRRGRR